MRLLFIHKTHIAKQMGYRQPLRFCGAEKGARHACHRCLRQIKILWLLSSNVAFSRQSPAVVAFRLRSYSVPLAEQKSSEKNLHAPFLEVVFSSVSDFHLILWFFVGRTSFAI